MNKVYVLLGVGLVMMQGIWNVSAEDFRLIYEPKPEDLMKVYIYRLSNGITVYLTENRELPRFYAEIAVRAGSQNDPPDTTGLAHYFEHLMFKGSERLGTVDYTTEKPLLDRIEELYEVYRTTQNESKRLEIYKEIDRLSQEASKYAIPNELDRIYKSLGGDKLNAHTWIDETVYKVELPSECLEHWAMLESDRFTAPVFRLFATELETVYEEKNRSMDNRDRVLWEAVNRALFPNHPFGTQTTLGDPEHLKNPSIRNIKRFFEQWYVPENIGIAISGDINIQEAIRVVAKYFSSIRAKDSVSSKDNPASGKGSTDSSLTTEGNASLPNSICSPVSNFCYEPLPERVSVDLTFEGEPAVLLAFRTVPKLHPDADALMLIDMILDNNVAGLINLNLNQKQRVRKANSYLIQLNDLGVEYLTGVPKEGQSLEEVEALLLEQIREICAGNFEDWLLPAIIMDYKKAKEKALETNEGRVGILTDVFIAREDWTRHLQRLERLEKITKEEVVTVARRYFTKGYVAGFRRDGERSIIRMPKPPLTPLTIESDKQSPFALSVLSLPVAEREPTFLREGIDYQRVSDPTGIEYWHTTNPLNRIFTLELRIPTGHYHDNRMNIALQLLEKSGTERFTAEELKKEWYKLGAEFYARSTGNETVVNLVGFDDRFEETLSLMMELLFKPRVEEAVWDELKRIILVQRADAKKDPNTVMSALVQYNRWDKDSDYLNLVPEEQLKQMTTEELLALTRKLLTYKHHVLYTGTLPLERVKELYSSSYKKYRDSEASLSPLKDAPPYKYLRAQKPSSNRIYLVDKEVAQTHLRIEFGVTEYNWQEQPIIDVFNAYFGGGMAGIVFQELREARALAYVAGAHYVEGYRKGDEDLMIGVIQTQPDKLPEALTTFIQLFEEMPISEERFSFAKESVIREMRTDKIPFRKLLGEAYKWSLHDIQEDPRKEWYEKVQKVTLDELLQFQRSRIQSKPKLISIMGPLNRIEIQSLSSLGETKRLSIDDIFAQ